MEDFTKGAFLAYLEGEELSRKQVVAINNLKRTVYRKPLYRAQRYLQYPDTSKKSFTFRRSFGSVSLTADAALGAATSYAHDFDIEYNYMAVYKIQEPIVLCNYNTLRRISDYEYVKKRTQKEKECIVLGRITYSAEMIAVVPKCAIM